MSQLSEYVRRRAIDNLVSGSIVSVKVDNPLLFDVRLADGRILTLPSAEKLSLSPGDAVQVVMPNGDRKRAYITGPAAVVLGGDPFNRILGTGEG